MADKEVREIHTTSGDSGASGMIVAAVLVAALLIGGLFFWNYAGDNRTASGPSVTVNTPGSTGQGGGGGGGGAGGMGGGGASK